MIRQTTDENYGSVSALQNKYLQIYVDLVVAEPCSHGNVRHLARAERWQSKIRQPVFREGTQAWDQIVCSIRGILQREGSINEHSFRFEL